VNIESNERTTNGLNLLRARERERESNDKQQVDAIGNSTCLTNAGSFVTRLTMLGAVSQMMVRVVAMMVDMRSMVMMRMRDLTFDRRRGHRNRRRRRLLFQMMDGKLIDNAHTHTHTHTHYYHAIQEV
jgi:hypothetical protein